MHKFLFQTKFLEKVFGLAEIPHPFDQQIKRTVIMFTKNAEDVNKGLEAGATLVGGTDLIKSIQTGEVALRNVDYAIATKEILPDVAPIRGLLKQVFPNLRHGKHS